MELMRQSRFKKQEEGSIRLLPQQYQPGERNNKKNLGLFPGLRRNSLGKQRFVSIHKKAVARKAYARVRRKTCARVRECGRATQFWSRLAL